MGIMMSNDNILFKMDDIGDLLMLLGSNDGD
jgi:hypothetical protein